MKTTLLALELILTVVFAVVSSTTIVEAVIGGTADTTDIFDAVGRVGSVGFDPSMVGGCSGSLISPSLFLSAAHCLGTHNLLYESRTGVSFDVTVPDEGLNAPFPGTEGSVYTLPGTVVTNPVWLETVNKNCLFNSQGGNINHCASHQGQDPDLAIVILDDPVAGVQPHTVAAEGYLDSLSQQELHDQTFTIIGYGLDAIVGGTDGVRRYAEDEFQSKTQYLVNVNNDNDPVGHACGGDSGGAYLLDDPTTAADDRIQVGAVNTGNQFCNNIEKFTRLDTKLNQCFINIVTTGAANGRTDWSDSCVFYWFANALTACPFYQEIQACANA